MVSLAGSSHTRQSLGEGPTLTIAWVQECELAKSEVAVDEMAHQSSRVGSCLPYCHEVVVADVKRFGRAVVCQSKQKVPFAVGRKISSVPALVELETSYKLVKSTPEEEDSSLLFAEEVCD